MCGIIAVLPTYDDAGPDPENLLEPLHAAQKLAPRISQDNPAAAVELLDETNSALRRAVAELSTVAAGRLLVVDNRLRAQAARAADAVHDHLNAVDAWLDATGAVWDANDIERVQAHLRTALDLTWTLREDRIAAAERIRHLAGLDTCDAVVPAADFPASAAVAYRALDTVLDALDRLEVRGRDSAGVHVWVQLDDEDLAALPDTVWKRRDVLFGSATIEPVAGGLSIVYKTASVIGRLGDNSRALRNGIATDTDLRAVLARPSARVTVMAHTRWASVGRVSQANAHPLNSITADGDTQRYVVAVLNGDIDNHLELRERESCPADSDITTDAKLVPVMMARRLCPTGPAGTAAGVALHDCLQSYQGSMAVCVQADDDPDRLLLGVKGGGQGLYIGLSPAGYVVASEVFGLVSQTSRYVRVTRDGTDAAPNRTGVVVMVDRRGRGDLSGVYRIDPTGVSHPFAESELRHAEVTTRDVARGPYERYLEKEMAEAASSFRKTLRGRVHTHSDTLSVDLPDSVLPARARSMLRDRQVDEIVLIGQGTAAVAAAGVAYLVDSLIHGAVPVRALPATELSAWQLHRDLRRTVVVAISQSGTTTDTNRTVDLVRERGAVVLAIVNRRDSDLVGKSDGVLYTSDGRDIEMAVASTKAFYSQVAAGMLLGVAFGKELGVLDPHTEHTHVRMLTEMPAKLEELERQKARIAAVAEQVAGRYPYWAVVGSGPNRIAADELRIKLSELCYRGVSADVVENKKHIDLSAESLVLVCAAGTPVTQMHDLIKEVDIFAAHRNQPLVITDAGTRDMWPTDLVIEVPPTHPSLAWILSTAAGHWFGYFAARAIDGMADDLRVALDALHDDADGGPAAAAAALGRFLDDCQDGLYRGVLGSDTALRLARAHDVLTGTATVRDKAAVDPIEESRQILTAAVDELTRSIDSVRHQAKTVTVGTSRSGVDLFENPLTRHVLDLGVDRNALTYSTLLALRGYSRVVSEVAGATQYVVGGSPTAPRIRVIGKSGIAAGLPSRADTETDLSGTKKYVVDTRSVRLERGLSDQRLVLIVPEVSGNRVTGITLLHVTLRPHASGPDLLAALEHAGTRLPELRAAITERNHAFDPDELAALPTELVLLAPADRVAAAVLER